MEVQVLSSAPYPNRSHALKETEFGISSHVALGGPVQVLSSAPYSIRSHSLKETEFGISSRIALGGPVQALSSAVFVRDSEGKAVKLAGDQTAKQPPMLILQRR